MARFLIVFFSVIVAAESFTLLKRQYDGPPETGSNGQLFECSAAASHCFHDNEISSLHNIESNIDAACIHIERLTSCLRTIPQHCQDEDPINVILPLAEFICSERGKSLVREFKRSSVCYNNQDKFDDVQSSVSLCLAQKVLQPGPAEREQIDVHCAEFNDLADCIQTVTASECGEAAGQIAGGLIDVLYQTAPLSQCRSQESLKRAADSSRLKRLLKRIVGEK